MDDFRKDEWDEKLDQELANLKEIQAPEALLHNVMQAVEERAAQPWYRCSYTEWPLVAQVASIIALSLVGLALYLLWPQTSDAQWLGQAQEQARQSVEAIDYTATGLSKAVAALSRVILNDYLLALAIIAVALNGIFCAAGTFVWKRTRNMYAQNGAY